MRALATTKWIAYHQFANILRLLPKEFRQALAVFSSTPAGISGKASRARAVLLHSANSPASANASARVARLAGLSPAAAQAR